MVKDYICITFGYVLMCNKILKGRNLKVWGEFLTFDIFLHNKALIICRSICVVHVWIKAVYFLAEKHALIGLF